MKTTSSVMKRMRLSVAVAAAVIATTAFAEEKAALVPAPSARNAITLNGKSTLHPFHATSSAFELTASVGATSENALQAALSGGLTGVEVKVPVKTLKSGDKGLDENMHKTLEAAKHPNIVFKLEKAEAAGPGKLKAKGKLTIAGNTRDVELLANAAIANGKLTLSGGVDLLMTSFGIKPPSMFFGTVNTEDKVNVTFELTLQAGPVVAAL